MSWFPATLGPKRLGLPAVKRVAVLANPNSPTDDTFTKEIQEAALALGMQVHVIAAGTIISGKDRPACLPKSTVLQCMRKNPFKIDD
jgi:hypothetical protein